MLLFFLFLLLLFLLLLGLKIGVRFHVFVKDVFSSCGGWIERWVVLVSTAFQTFYYSFKFWIEKEWNGIAVLAILRQDPMERALVCAVGPNLKHIY